jgi:hypothetical protein
MYQVPPFLLLDESIQLRLIHIHTHRTSILIFLFFSGDSELDGVEFNVKFILGAFNVKFILGARSLTQGNSFYNQTAFFK